MRVVILFYLISVLFISIVLFCIFSTLTFLETIKYSWEWYSKNTNSVMGFFSILGTIFTAGVFYITYRSNKNAERNTEIAESNIRLVQESIDLSKNNNRKDDFIKQFTLLLELHGKYHDILVEHLNSEKVIGEAGSSCLIRWNMLIKEASEKLYQNYIFSSYMRIVYRILKHIDQKFYLSNINNSSSLNLDEEKKQYTSIVRSTIRNDVLFFIALNSLNKEFSIYKDLLNKFDFFEHLNTRYISDDIIFNLESYSPSLHFAPYGIALDESLINEALNYHIYSDFVKKKHVDKFKIQLPNTFIIDIMRNYAKKQYDAFLKEVENKINPFDIMGSINEHANRFNFINLKFYCYNVYNAMAYDGGYSSNDFKLRRNGTKSVDETLERILLTKVSEDNFRVFKRNGTSNILFAYDKEKNDSTGVKRFFDDKNIYCMCMDLHRDRELKASVINGCLLKKVKEIILTMLMSTDLVKSTNVIVQVGSDNRITLSMKE